MKGMPLFVYAREIKRYSVRVRVLFVLCSGTCGGRSFGGKLRYQDATSFVDENIAPDAISICTRTTPTALCPAQVKVEWPRVLTWWCSLVELFGWIRRSSVRI